MSRVRLGLLAAALLAVAASAFAPALLPGIGGGEVEAAFTEARPLVVEARPIHALRPFEPERRRFGALEFIGGLVLSSRDRAFGGLSGLRTRDHGREILAIGDEGSWFFARLRSDPDGRPTGIDDAVLAPLLDERGRPFRGKWWRDAESLTLHGDGDALEARVGFEHRHRILAYRSTTGARGLLDAPGKPIPLPAEIAALPVNSGLEALADRPAGAPLVALAEDPEPGATANPGWILGLGAPRRFRVATDDGYALTDAAFLPSGDLLVLERRLSVFGRFAARLGRIAAADLAENRTATPQILYESSGGEEIDNMEGLAVDVGADGSTLITLISDDNFFFLQRTLLLRFRLVEETGKAGRS
jgi:hypothetical protein